jgi:hypothetical protein
VEATLEALIQAETEPLEEKLKPLLLDVVRSCQSTLGHRWSMIKGTKTTLASTQHQPPFAPVDRQHVQRSSTGTDNIHETWEPLPNVIVAPAIIEAAYQEPRLLGFEESSETAEAFKKSKDFLKPLTRAPDSGYSSFVSEDLCHCDEFFDFSFRTTEQSGTLGPPMSSAPGLRQGCSTSITDVRSEDQGRSRCELCGGLLPLTSSTNG